MVNGAAGYNCRNPVTPADYRRARLHLMRRDPVLAQIIKQRNGTGVTRVRVRAPA